MPGFSERSERGRKARKKGIAYELDVAQAFKHLYPEAKRLHGQGRSGNDWPDVGGTDFWIECSDSKQQIVDKLLQGIRDSQETTSHDYRLNPVLVASKRKGVHMITMRRDQFIKLLEYLDLAEFALQNFG